MFVNAANENTVHSWHADSLLLGRSQSSSRHCCR